MNEVKWLLQDKAPHIPFISEGNLRREHERNLVEVDGYSLITTKMIRCPEKKVSRIVAYIKDGLITNRRDDLETEDFSALWLEVGLPHRKKFLVCGVYREWAYLRTNCNSNADSSSIVEQERRWNLFLDSWEDALDETDDISVIGDVNIDLLKVFDRRNHSCKKMAEELKLRILSRRVVQLVQESTRFAPNCEPSLLDHIYMTRPDLGSYQVSEWGTSDHRLIELLKKNKGSLPQASRLRKRTFKQFSLKNFIQDIKSIKWYSPVYSKENVNEAAEGWHNEFSRVLDKHCPVRSIEVKKNYTPWLTQDLVIASKSLQRVLKRSKIDHSQELKDLLDVRHYC